MLSPLLIIGVGGAGGKTIRAMKQELNRILESSGHTDGIPAAWQFLQIDTTIDGVDFPAPMLHQDEFHCVVPQGSIYPDILSSITARGSLHEQQGMLTGWGIPAPAIWINNSPPQHRAIGRLAILADAGKTLQAIQKSISKMQSPTAIAELARIAGFMGSRSPNSHPQAFIISSLGGGSGSGMFTDVAELLKRATPNNWAHQSISFLYTPEVFRSSGAAVKSVPKNTLGAMNELIASKWVGVSDRSNLLYSKLGLVPGNNASTSGYGCKTNILIGSRNVAGVDISVGANGGGMNNVFLNIGKSLAAAFSNDDISDFLSQRAFVTVAETASAIDISGLAPESVNVDNPTLAAAGIGFGQLSVGADHVVDYVADAMAKVQVETLLWPELTNPLLMNGASVKDLIQDKSDQVWPNFLVDSGLDERGSQNQIIDALLPDQLSDRIKQYVVGIVKVNLSSASKPLETFCKAVWSDWETESDAFLRTLKNEMDSKAQNWVPEIQNQMQELIARELVLNGYAIITNLVERLKSELADHVVPDLNREHTEFASAISTFDQRAFNTRMNEIANGLTGVSTQNGLFLEKLTSSLNRLVVFQVNAYVNSLASSLVEDMLKFFIEPLIEQLSDARFTLQASQKSPMTPNGASNPYPHFPTWGSGVFPPIRYLPGTLQRVLIDPRDYESAYDIYASQDSNGKPPFRQSVRDSLLGKKMNPMPGESNMQKLISVNSPWITSVRAAQSSMGAAANKVEWKFNTDLVELSENNRRWLKNADSSFGRFTDMSIREYVSADGQGPQIRAGREAKFVGEYQAMLGCAQPLILLNPNAMQHVLNAFDGGYAGGVLLKSSKIPFEMSSPVGQQCTLVLQQNGFDPRNPSFEQEWFHPGSNDSSMSAVSTTQAALPAWAYDCLTNPILEQVAQSKNAAGTWIQFWEGRRTRPLTEAVPFETEIRRSIITGWFVASLFGMRKVLPLAEGRTVQIWNPTLETPDWSSFPSPLLATHREDSRHESWVLPQLLMSAGIALAEFGFTGNPEYLNGYRLLKYLGREVTTSFRNRDNWDGSGSGDLLPAGERSKSNYLKSWVESGESPYQNGTLVTPLQVSLALTPDRAEALIKTVQLLSTEYKNIWSEMSSRAWHDLPETWELREDIDLALSDIAKYVSELRNSTSSNIA
jgi:hypothetical protein